VDQMIRIISSKDRTASKSDHPCMSSMSSSVHACFYFLSLAPLFCLNDCFAPLDPLSYSAVARIPQLRPRSSSQEPQQPLQGW